MADKPSIPKGTRDFSPTQMVKRNYIFDTIKQVFQRYGYLPIETPAMENIETLTGKYGEEGDQLLFKVLNSRIHESKTKEKSKDDFNKMLEHSVNSPYLTEKALKYDLTVPFARYVVQHQHEITFPFKRYQIQPVWRGDRPAKGRYREFYQCDADVIGSDSLINEVELVQIIDEVFTKLKVPVIVKINNRKILSGIAELIGEKERIIDITIALDKYDKIGEGIYDELRAKGLKEDVLLKLRTLMTELRSVDVGGLRVKKLKELFKNIPIGVKGVEEVDYVFKTLSNIYLGTGREIPIVDFDISLARGLNYYTGAIFEVKVNDLLCSSTFTSSITGGGRYDDLTGIFGLPNMSGVGISFGADRIYDVLEELNLFPEEVGATTKLLFVTFGETEQNYCLPLLAGVRKAGINSEIYPDATAKMKKQMSYADDKKIPFVVIVGGDEMQNGMLSLKNMHSGEQKKISIDELIETLK